VKSEKRTVMGKQVTCSDDPATVIAALRLQRPLAHKVILAIQVGDDAKVCATMGTTR
jgi:hypothetical protein